MDTPEPTPSEEAPEKPCEHLWWNDRLVRGVPRKGFCLNCGETREVLWPVPSGGDFSPQRVGAPFHWGGR